MDRTIYYRLTHGDRAPEKYRSAAQAIADCQEGDEAYEEIISGTRHTRFRVWPAPLARDPESWSE